MFSHVMVGCSDLDRSRRFYDAVFGTLASARHPGPAPDLLAPKTGLFAPRCRSTASRRRWATAARSALRAIPREGRCLACRGRGERRRQLRGSPASGRSPAGQLYLAYLRDPDGNKLCASYPLPEAGCRLN